MQEHNQLKFIDKEQELFPGLHIKIFNGHTNGQIIPYIEFNGRTLIYTADLLPSTGHIPLPYIMSYDTRPLLTLDEKTKFLQEAVNENHTFFFEHDNYTECCTVKDTPKGPRLDKKLTLQEFIENK